MRTPYERLVEDFASRKPRPTYKSEQTENELKKLRSMLHDFRRSSSTKTNGSSGNSSMLALVKRTFNIYAIGVTDSLRGNTPMMDRIPVTQLRRAMRELFEKTTNAAWEKGIFVHTIQVNDYRYLIDFRNGYVCDLFAVFHQSSETTRASAVTKTTTRNEFDRQLAEKGETKIESAVMWQRHEESNIQLNKETRNFER